MSCPRDPMTCLHGTHGLCPSCRQMYLEDPAAWLEYGHHAAGQENWRRLQEEMAEAARDVSEPFHDNDTPF